MVPSSDISRWIDEQHEGGVKIGLVRESEIESEPDLLCDLGKHKGEYLGLPFLTLGVARAEGLWLAAPEIIRFSHGASSSAKQYQHAFIPRLHDVCFVLKRGQPEA